MLCSKLIVRFNFQTFPCLSANYDHLLRTCSLNAQNRFNLPQEDFLNSQGVDYLENQCENGGFHKKNISGIYWVQFFLTDSVLQPNEENLESFRERRTATKKFQAEVDNNKYPSHFRQSHANEQFAFYHHNFFRTFWGNDKIEYP